MIRIRTTGVLAAGLALLAAAWAGAAEDTQWKAGAALDYESGDYGTGTRSSTLYMPFTLKRYWGDAYGSLTVPWESVVKASDFILVPGHNITWY